MKGLKLGKQTEERAIIHNSAELTQKKNQEEIQTLKRLHTSMTIGKCL